MKMNSAANRWICLSRILKFHNAVNWTVCDIIFESKHSIPLLLDDNNILLTQFMCVVVATQIGDN